MEFLKYALKISDSAPKLQIGYKSQKVEIDR